MKAQNLTISVPNRGCDKACGYCISKITGELKTDESLFLRNMPKVKRIAESANVSSILITGKGEPTLNPGAIDFIVETFKDYPIEIQTNGIAMLRNFSKYRTVIPPINVIAFSIDSPDQLYSYKRMFNYLHDSGVVVRITLNSNNLFRNWAAKDMISFCEAFGVRQLSIRKLTVPNYVDSIKLDTAGEKAVTWIKENGDDSLYVSLQNDLKTKRLIRKLPFGALVYDYDGISVIAFEYCIQDENDGENIRSLIYQEDGHLYTSWDTPASILF